MIKTATQLRKEINEILDNKTISTKEKDLFIGSAKKELYRNNYNEYLKFVKVGY